jgi:hypothetical protein
MDLEIEDLINLAKKAGYNIKISNIEEGDKFNWYKQYLPENIFEKIN